ncbi:MAG: hypothetical protein M3P85_00965 [Actinomycetota bacterium]|nr:hypothetical protein [Actinomycetota bacterium]PLS74773.1 MAG: hypothetical protein CYG61_10665 [Actinomycetota bacterium]
MADRRLKVTRSSEFERKARGFFPPGGSPDGKPSFELFEKTVLKAVELAFSRMFDDLPLAKEGLGAIRAVSTQAVPHFPPLVVYGMLVTDATVDLMDIEVDEDFWDRLAAD